ncbi:MAG: hypothetical protein RBU25_15570 [Lentisphaeria bacterium]|nr:hypothetical protein [Lentisphaeria bacterium]
MILALTTEPSERMTNSTLAMRPGPVKSPALKSSFHSFCTMVAKAA